MKEMCKIVHNDYERISDRVFWLSADYLLRFNVDLYIKKLVKNSPDKEKINYHREVGYVYDNKFGIKITRDFSYYFTIESVVRNPGDKTIRINIGPSYIYGLKYKMDIVIDAWFKSGNVFGKLDGKIAVIAKQEIVRIDADYGNYIELTPAVYVINGVEQTGVQWFINGTRNGFFLTIDNMLALQYLLNNFNMYMAAQNMVNYISRPENGTNYIDLSPSELPPTGFFNRINQNKEDR